MNPRSGSTSLASSRPVRYPLRNRKTVIKWNRVLLAFIFVVACSILPYYLFSNQQGRGAIDWSSHPLPPTGLHLSHEDIFSKTIKSCMGQHCKRFVPEKSLPRIALVTPPGSIGSAFLQLLRATVDQGAKKVSFDLVHTTAIPPYGYGKTHGWTAIIRIVPSPLLAGIVDTWQAYEKPSTTRQTLPLLESMTRLQIRYHCRLSHVAAHTALWSISMADMVSDRNPTLLIRQIQSFLGLSEGLEPSLQMQSAAATLGKEVDAILRETSAALESSDSTNLLDEVDRVLLEEMKISKNLTAWPCESFWTVGEEPVAAQIAAALSPNCSAPFTSCFVKRDKCEYEGRGAC